MNDDRPAAVPYRLAPLGVPRLRLPVRQMRGTTMRTHDEYGIIIRRDLMNAPSVTTPDYDPRVPVIDEKQLPKQPAPQINTCKEPGCDTELRNRRLHRCEVHRAERRREHVRRYKQTYKRNRDTELSNRCARYGISVETYRQMHQKQSGACMICRGVDEDGRALAIDHDHVTGVVRGLLCSPCNRGLGLYRDEPKLLRAAAKYLEGTC